MKTLAELQAIRDKARAQIGIREEDKDAVRVLVGMATCGIAAGARPVLNAFVEEVAKRNMTEKVAVTQTGCIGICQYEPVVEIACPGQEKVTYVKMTPEKRLSRVVSTTILSDGNVVTEYTIGAIRTVRRRSNMYRCHVLVCGGTGCTSSNSEKIIEKPSKDEIKARGLENEVNVVRTGCFGLCALGPIMIVYPEGAFYSMVKVEDVPEIVEEHLLKGRIVKRLLYRGDRQPRTTPSKP
ncbi:MAG: (2Fe-2S) ferredoxin domain-containing protein [[Clostridium] leptum]